MQFIQFEVWIADLNPQVGTEAGKARLVIVVQTDLLNKVTHPSTIICPITTNVQNKSEILRVHLKKGIANLHKDCDIMIDQIRAIDNKRLVKRLGIIPNDIAEIIKENISIMIDLEQ